MKMIFTNDFSFQKYLKNFRSLNIRIPRNANPFLFARDSPTKDRVLRGGSFNNNEDNARCSIRNNNHPDNRNNNNGFRVVVSTLFTENKVSSKREAKMPELQAGSLAFFLPRQCERYAHGRHGTCRCLPSHDHS